MIWRLFIVVLLTSSVTFCYADGEYINRMRDNEENHDGIRVVPIVDDPHCEHPLELYNPRNALGKFVDYGSGIVLTKALDSIGLGMNIDSNEDMLIALVKDLDWIDPELELKIGTSSYEKLEQSGDIMEDDDLYMRLHKISQPIISSIPAGLLPYDIKIKIINDNVNGSYTLPGGFILVTAKDLSLSDETLAFIIAHELAHVTKRHTIRLYQARIGELIELPVLTKYMSSGGSDPSGIIGLVIGLKKYDADYNVDQEHQADVCAIRYLVASNLDSVSAMSNFLEETDQQFSIKTQNEGGWEDLMKQLTRDHPDYDDRSQVLLAAISYYSKHDAKITSHDIRLAATGAPKNKDSILSPVTGAVGTLVKGVGSAIGAGIKGISSLLPRGSEAPSHSEDTSCNNRNPLSASTAAPCH